MSVYATRCIKPEERSWKKPGRCWPPALRLVLLLLSGMGLGWLGAMGCTASRPGPDYQLISQAWRTIQHKYVDRSAAQSKEITYGAISGMVDALGDTGHSTFLTPQMVKELKRLERGEFKGVGLEIQMKNGHVVIVAPIDGSPAQRAGLKSGEIIQKVAGQDIADWPLSRVAEQISGPAGTPVTLTLENPRTAQTRQVTLVRASIKLHVVTWQRLPGTAFAHVRIASFDAGATKGLRKALAAIERDQLKGIVLDLRNNPGGLLDEAIGVTSQFLKAGNVLLTKDAQGQTEPVPVEPGGLAPNLPLAVLINQGSASAAEIVAGALQDHHRATLVGETTFGTGTVLGQFYLSDGSALLLAIEEWLTPSGRSFWHKGLPPQIPIPLPAEVFPLLPSAERELTPEQFQATEDRQLLRALQVLKQSTNEMRVQTKARQTNPKVSR